MRVHHLRHRHTRHLHPLFLLPGILPKAFAKHLGLPSLGIRFNVPGHSWRPALSDLLHRRLIEVLPNTGREPPRANLLGLRDLYHDHTVSPDWKQKHPASGGAQSQDVLHPLPLPARHWHLPHIHVPQVYLLRIEHEQAAHQRLQDDASDFQLVLYRLDWLPFQILVCERSLQPGLLNLQHRNCLGDRFKFFFSSVFLFYRSDKCQQNQPDFLFKFKLLPPHCWRKITQLQGILPAFNHDCFHRVDFSSPLFWFSNARSQENLSRCQNILKLQIFHSSIINSRNGRTHNFIWLHLQALHPRHLSSSSIQREVRPPEEPLSKLLPASQPNRFHPGMC